MGAGEAMPSSQDYIVVILVWNLFSKNFVNTFSILAIGLWCDFILITLTKTKLYMLQFLVTYKSQFYFDWIPVYADMSKSL
jgi:hypothetical protein